MWGIFWATVEFDFNGHQSKNQIKFLFDKVSLSGPLFFFSYPYTILLEISTNLKFDCIKECFYIVTYKICWERSHMNYVTTHLIIFYQYFTSHLMYYICTIYRTLQKLMEFFLFAVHIISPQWCCYYCYTYIVSSKVVLMIAVIEV